ncbi:hypothetical protein NX059_002533 [Plenodomus lindquistii]|nr:hypothetical protein NX059_002533 [Plenodomus lindquistii]
MFSSHADPYSPRQPEECTPDPTTVDQEATQEIVVDPSYAWRDIHLYPQPPPMVMGTETSTQGLHVSRSHAPNTHGYCVAALDPRILEPQVCHPVPDHSPPQPLNPDSSFLSPYGHQPTSVITTGGGHRIQHLSHTYRLREHQVYQDYRRKDASHHVDVPQGRSLPGYDDVEQGEHTHAALVGISSSAHHAAPYPTFMSSDSETKVPYEQPAYGGSSYGSRFSSNSPAPVPSGRGHSQMPCVQPEFPQTYSGATETTDSLWPTWGAYNHAELQVDMGQTMSPLDDGGRVSQGDEMNQGSGLPADSIPTYEHLLGACSVMEKVDEAKSHKGDDMYHPDHSGITEHNQVPRSAMGPSFNWVVREGTPASSAEHGHSLMSGEELQFLSPSDARSSSHTSPCSSPGSSPASETLRCNPCNTEFTGKHKQGNFCRHIRNKHGCRLYACAEDGCNKVFQRQDARLKHYRGRHSHLAPGRPESRKYKRPGSYVPPKQ